MMAAPRPQQPHGMKLAEMKKAAVVGRKKVAGKLEGVHQLRLLDNRYVQYRLLNARGHRRLVRGEGGGLEEGKGGGAPVLEPDTARRRRWCTRGGDAGWAGASAGPRPGQARRGFFF